jgi:hydrogenase expression/formation protein HypD
MEALHDNPARRVDGFLAAGHVCTIMGIAEYVPIADKYRVPVVVTGFEPVDILQGIHMCVAQLEQGRAEVENQYPRAVRSQGNEHALRRVREVFEVVPRQWRGIGPIPRSGLALRAEFADHDAERKFGVAALTAAESSECISGRILQGLMKPPECPAFGTRCTPESPLGATMVSSEGACAAYYRYRRSSPWRTTTSS